MDDSETKSKNLIRFSELGSLIVIERARISGLAMGPAIVGKGKDPVIINSKATNDKTYYDS